MAGVHVAKVYIFTTLPVDFCSQYHIDPGLFDAVSYDGLGRKEWESNQTSSSGNEGDGVPNSEIKDFEYDMAGRLISVELPEVDDPEDSPDAGETVRPIYSYFYDSHGSTRQLIDNTGLPTGIDDSLSYDAYGIMLDSKFVVM